MAENTTNSMSGMSATRSDEIRGTTHYHVLSGDFNWDSNDALNDHTSIQMMQGISIRTAVMP